MNSEQLIAMLRSIRHDHELSHSQREALARAIGLVMATATRRKAIKAAAGLA